jgi:hypothetical protein
VRIIGLRVYRGAWVSLGDSSASSAVAENEMVMMLTSRLCERTSVSVRKVI